MCLRGRFEARLSIFYEQSEIKYPTVGTGHVRTESLTLRVVSKKPVTHGDRL